LLLFASIGLYLFSYYFSTSTVIAKALCAGGLLGLFLVTWAVQRVFFVPRDAYGKATFASSSDVRQAELFKRGPIIGKAKGRHLRFDKARPPADLRPDTVGQRRRVPSSRTCSTTPAQSS
jgi:hypothetical protein